MPTSASGHNLTPCPQSNGSARLNSDLPAGAAPPHHPLSPQLLRPGTLQSDHGGGGKLIKLRNQISDRGILRVARLSHRR